MRLEGRWEPRYPIDEVWAVLCDPDVLAKHAPGVQSMEEVGSEQFKLDLHGAFIRRTKLRGARLERANLAGADCAGADFSFTNLKSANLTGANFSKASLRGADLEDANLAGTDFRGADLTDARNLTARQLREAIVDEATRLPELVLER